jgi:addiction module HigA family antidote
MLMTKRKPVTVGEILVKEFMKPIGLTQGALADAMGVQSKHVNELCNDRRNVTAATALILARVFGNSADFWLNVQRRSDMSKAMRSPRERKTDGGGRELRRLVHGRLARNGLTMVSPPMPRPCCMSSLNNVSQPASIAAATISAS